MSGDSVLPSEDDDLYAEPATAGDEDAFLAGLLDAPDVEPPLQAGQQLGEHFTIVRELGAGGMGRVYLAFDNDLDRAVAIKVHRERVDAEAVARMRGEAKAIARLSHPNVVGVFEVGEVDGRMFIVMEYIDGTRLDRWQTQGDRGWERVLSAYMQAGDALVAAHRAGLVHRDFKPQNVMVLDEEETLRVRVLDFGLARAVESHHPGGEDIRDGFMTDGRVGTPAYVAPEQRIEGIVSPAADQYSFAVSLWEALCGQRPPGAMLDGFHAPRWLLEVVRRGWAADPSDRWPSMREFLDALAADPALRRRRVGAIVGAFALVGVGGIGAQALADDAACPDPAAALGAAWGDERRAAIRAAFAQSGVVYADDVLEALEPRVDAYVASWVDATNASCRGEDGVPAGLRPRSALCLDHRRRDLSALTEGLAAADAVAVERALEAVERLQPMTRCTDLERLSAEVAEPSEAEAAAVERIRTQLARLSTQRELGRAAVAVEEARTLAHDTASSGYRPIVAEVNLERGRMEIEVGAFAEAEASLRGAFTEAVGVGDDVLALRSAQALISVVGHDLARPAEGHEWAFHATARHGRPGTAGMESRTWAPQATLFKDQGRYQDAIALYEQAREAVESREDASALELADAINAVGAGLSALNDFEGAKASYAQALELFESELPAEHPRIAMVLANLSSIYEQLGELDVALELLERARDIRERALPPDHPSHGDTYRTLGTTLRRLGRHDEALEAYERSIELMVKSRGPTHPRVGNLFEVLGELHSNARRFQEAEDAFVRAVSILEGSDGGQAFLPGAVLGLGNVLVRRGKLEEGRRHLERAVTLFEEQEGPTSVALPSALMALGITHLMQGELEQALRLYERAQATDEAAGRTVDWTVWMNMANAHSMSGNGERALEFNTRALEALEAELGTEHPSLIDLLSNRGFMFEDVGQRDEARAAYERALTIAIKNSGEDSPLLGVPLEGLGAMDLDDENYASAVTRLRHSVRVLEGGGIPARTAEVQFLLAKALWGSKSPQEAIRAALQARETYASLEASESKVERIDAWLAEPSRRRAVKAAGTDF